MDTPRILKPSRTSLAPEVVDPPANVFYYRKDQFLIVRDGATLPSRCVRTNRETGPDDWTERARIFWMPRWAILLNFLIILLGSLVPGNKAKITYSLIRDERSRIVKRRGIGVIILFAGVVVAIQSAVHLEGNAAMAGRILGSIAALGGLASCAMTNALKVKKYKDGWFTLGGCSPEFLDSL